MTLPPAAPMNESETPSSRAATTAAQAAGTVSRYFHGRGAVLYIPSSDESLATGGPGFRAVSLVRGGLSADVEPAVLEQLRAARFLIDDLDSETRRTHLLFVSLET